MWSVNFGKFRDSEVETSLLPSAYVVHVGHVGQSILWSDRPLFPPNPLSERENSVRNSTAMEEPEVHYQRQIGPECGVQW